MYQFLKNKGYYILLPHPKSIHAPKLLIFNANGSLLQNPKGLAGNPFPSPPKSGFGLAGSMLSLANYAAPNPRRLFLDKIGKTLEVNGASLNVHTLVGAKRGFSPNLYAINFSIEYLCEGSGCFLGFFLTVWGSLCCVDFLFFSHCEFQHRRQILTGRSLLGGEYVLF